MPPRNDPSPVEAFLRAIVRTGLSDEPGLLAVWRKIPAALRQTPATVAEFLVRTGFLTRFQADKLLAGAERGLTLGPYHLLAPIGRGGMGHVYLARDTRDQRLVALKVLPPKKYREEERLLARFRREMELC